MKKSLSRRAAALGLAAALTASLAGCGSSNASSPAAPAASAVAATGAADTVNIGSTSSLGTLNPLLIDSSWINMYAMELMFQPLVAMNDAATFDNMLADSITSEDGLVYTVHINSAATWSDGQSVTSADAAFTILRMASGVIANPNLMLSALQGTDEAGHVPEGATEFAGVSIVDDKTFQLHLNGPMSMESFLTGYAQYIFVLPAHVLADVPEKDLATYSWFSAPTVVDGPYMVTAFDNDHYISYTANENYWGGPVNIPHLNIRIVDASGLYAGLQSGELDVVPPLLGSIPQEDYENVQALEGITAKYGSAYAAESLFLNCETISDVRIRKAMLLALDRQTIVDGLLGGAGKLYDGFAVPDGPYATGMAPTQYSESEAAALVAEATAEGWDPATTYTMYLNSGDATLINAATVAQAQWQAVGINVELVTVDLDTLMTNANNGEGDLFGVQYTYATADPSWDISWVLSGWCRFADDAVTGDLNTLWSTADSSDYKSALAEIDSIVQANVPVIQLYVTGPLGAVNSRIAGCSAGMYGCLNNVAEWSINS